MKRAFQFGNKISAAFIALFTLLAVFTPSLPMIEPFRDHLAHALVFLMISGFIGLFINSRTILFTSFGCAMLIAIFLKNASNTELKNPEINHKTSLKIQHINLSLIYDVQVLTDLIKQDSTIDIYSFQEYTPDWASTLSSILPTYIYHIDSVRIDVFGKALFSKYPINNVKHYNEQYHDICQNIVVGIDTFQILSTYILPALDSASRIQAGLQLKQISEYSKDVDHRLIVLGEFNQVYWSADLIDFRRLSDLSNSRRDVNIGITKMPYNHIFFSHDLECFSFSELRDKDDTHIGCKGSFQIKSTNTLQ